MVKLSHLKPEEIWRFFEEICTIPRPSKKEGKIVEYLKKFGESHNLRTQVDAAGNVLISKPATKGMENRAAIVLQSHVDMVCEKNTNIKHNFDTDPIKPYIDGDWVKAEGTTLGADDGIGMAAQLAILNSNDIQHGTIECLFTVDEETGLTGAFALKPDFFSGKILLNLDSEDEGEIFIGCAGGIDTLATFNYKTEKASNNHSTFALKITGLKGGHSGDDINKGLGNSIKIATRFLSDFDHLYKARIVSFDGGNLRNAIPRETTVIFTVPTEHITQLTNYTEKLVSDIKKELCTTEPNLHVECKQIETNLAVIDTATQFNLLKALHGVWNGVVEMSRDIHGLVETSTNLASVKFINENKIVVTTSQRSSSESQKKYIAQTVEAVFTLANAKVEHSDGYPGWQPNNNSKILNVAIDTYKKMFGIEPKVKAIHAGLECGLFLEKYPELDMISFGPTLRDVHSPDERINIDSTKKFWEYLIEIIKNTPEI